MTLVAEMSQATCQAVSPFCEHDSNSRRQFAHDEHKSRQVTVYRVNHALFNPGFQQY
jgi:hypothetical protein